MIISYGKAVNLFCERGYFTEPDAIRLRYIIDKGVIT